MAISPLFLETPSSGEGPCSFSHLRGVRWRMGLGILPPSAAASIDDLRRVTANSRRSYAALRRQLLVDPHILKDGSTSPDLVMDNPLSQDPDSMWSRFFRNAELERMVDQDLTRLYPEHGCYFQTAGCQGMLRRILLLWCLRHPEYGYRQGMHELLAPLLYVLHVDVEYLLEVRKLYEDYFTDKFDGFSFHENDSTYKFDFKKFSESSEDGKGSDTGKISSLSDLDTKIQAVVLVSDAYGAEGELGVLLSEKFMEHDAYCMFDALMSGAGGAVSMAEFFSPLPVSSSSHSGFPPVIEASATMYHLLSIVDSSVHSHLVELGVEPQYFALRWLRVLFGREFALEDLLEIWDDIFACENTKLGRSAENDSVSSCAVLDSYRGAFISAFAVSMILHLRSSLLATENATSCLQRLLNFPDDINLGKLIRKAKSLQALAMDASNSIPLLTLAGLYDGSKSTVVRGHSLSLDSTSLRAPLNVVPDSYWEERWRVLHKEEERKQGVDGKRVSNHKKGWPEKVRLRLSRTESEPSHSKVDESKKIPKSSVRRSLLADLARQLGSDEDTEKLVGDENLGTRDPVQINEPDDDNNFTCTSEHSSRILRLSRVETEPSASKVDESKKNRKSSVRRSLLADLARQLRSDEDTELLVGDENLGTKGPVEINGPDSDDNNFTCTSEQRCLIGNAASEENSSIFSDPTSPNSRANDQENGSERSSVGSNSSIDEIYSDAQKAESCETSPENSELPVSDKHENSPLPVSDNAGDISLRSDQRDNPLAKSVTGLKERMLRSGKFQWLLKFGRHPSEGTSGKEVGSDATKGCNGGSDQSGIADFSPADGCNISSGIGKGECVDQNLMLTLKNLGQSMLENIQVIESVFQQDRGQAGPLENFSKNALVGRGQVTAITALKELRKISNLLSEL